MVAPKTRRVVRIESFGGPDVLTPVVEPMPSVSRDDVVIEVAAAGVNFADTMVRRGTYRKTQRLPHLPGAEVAGTVVHAPPRSGLEPGMHVAGFLEHGEATQTMPSPRPHRSSKSTTTSTRSMSPRASSKV